MLPINKAFAAAGKELQQSKALLSFLVLPDILQYGTSLTIKRYNDSPSIFSYLTHYFRGMGLYVTDRLY